MPPKNSSNMIFNIKTYKKIFYPLQKINESDYNFIITLISEGADIKRTEIPPPTSNPPYPQPDNDTTIKVTTKLLHHIDLGQFRGPYNDDNLPAFKYKIHYSPITAKTKPSGKAMILIDQSAPLICSINSEILDSDKKTIYSTFEQLCDLLLRIGINGFIWIIDAVDAYYRIPIQQRFHHLFGIKWLTRTLIFKCLSFGLSTAPSIYNRFADQFVWACKYYKKQLFFDKNTNLFNILHYLDDFFGGSPKLSTAKAQMKFLINLFKKLNIPTNQKKVIGPTKSAVILGWACRTFPKIQIGLSEPKRIKYLSFLKLILKNNVVQLNDIEKLVGYIRHTIKIYIIGNKFIRNIEIIKFLILSLIKNGKASKFTKLTLSPGAKFEINIWIKLYSDLKSRYFDIHYIYNTHKLPNINVWTDASTSYGAGGYSSNSDIYHLPWSQWTSNLHLFNSRFELELSEHIIYLELFALVLMAYLYAHTWSFKHINFYCDNRTVVHAINKGSLRFDSKFYYPKANLLTFFARLALKYNFRFTAHPIDGDKNPIADALSRSDDYKRSQIYKSLNKKPFTPFSKAFSLLNSTCCNKFSSIFPKF